MRLPRQAASWALVGVLSLGVVACSGDADTGAGSEGQPWEAETTTEGDVTTVRTIAGSVWGGPARVEESLSIGVDQGDEQYMFGRIQGVAGTGDRIYVLDASVPAVRIYDDSGRHLLDVGAEGDGPGEFRRPDALLVGDDGRIFVRDSNQGRITIFDGEGAFLETWPLDQGFVIGGSAMVQTADGKIYSPGRVGEMPEEMDLRSIGRIQMGMVPRGPDGNDGEPVPRPVFDYEPPRFTQQRRSGENVMVMMRSVPFAADIPWTFSPSGAMIAGVSNAYSFDIIYPGGAITRAEKAFEPVPIAGAERDWHIEQVTAQMREGDPEWTWTGPEMAAVKPAFSQLVADRSGRIWVIRPGAGRENPNCEKDAETGVWDPPCWSNETLYDVFDIEGAYLGAVEVPADFALSQQSWVEGDEIVTRIEDEMGVFVVKKYRLVTPANTP
jgi:hypothetical protein